MIRLTALWLFILAVGVLSFRNWYRGVLGLVALMAVVEHPDFPKTLAGIQGLNPWNILLTITVASWLVNRRKEGLTWDLPGGIAFLLVVYLFLVVVAFLRAATDLGPVIEYAYVVGSDDLPTFAGLFSDHIINCIKWVIPALMLYDGCRDENRLRETVIVIIGVYFLLAVQIIRWMPFAALSAGENLGERALKILSNEVGYHRVNLSMMMSGAAWAAMYAAGLWQNRFMRMGFYLAAAAITLGMALTGGRTGYVTWIIMGAGYAWLRSKKMFLILPVVGMVALAVVPGMADRLLSGVGDKNVDQNVAIEKETNVAKKGKVDLYTVTSGRTFAWPFVLDKIEEKPLLGYGRMAMQRAGVALYLQTEYGESFPHPHNMYLEWVFDNGILGAIPIILFYGTVLLYAFRMIRGSPRDSAVGGITIALVGALFVAGFGSQTFYPREGAVCLWIAMMMTIRWYHLRTTVAQRQQTEVDGAVPAWKALAKRRGITA
jgi:O-antigen ligase